MVDTKFLVVANPSSWESYGESPLYERRNQFKSKTELIDAALQHIKETGALIKIDTKYVEFEPEPDEDGDLYWEIPFRETVSILVEEACANDELLREEIVEILGDRIFSGSGYIEPETSTSKTSKGPLMGVACRTCYPDGDTLGYTVTTGPAEMPIDECLKQAFNESKPIMYEAVCDTVSQDRFDAWWNSLKAIPEPGEWQAFYTECERCPCPV